MSQALISHFGRSVTITRVTAGTYGGDGYFTQGTQGTFTITASVQPLSARDLLSQPEGNRTKEQIKIYSTVPLYTDGTDGSGNPVSADTVTLGNRTYKVMSCENYSDLIGSPMTIVYYKSILMTINEPSVTPETPTP